MGSQLPIWWDERESRRQDLKDEWGRPCSRSRSVMPIACVQQDCRGAMLDVQVLDGCRRPRRGKVGWWMEDGRQVGDKSEHWRLSEACGQGSYLWMNGVV